MKIAKILALITFLPTPAIAQDFELGSHISMMSFRTGSNQAGGADETYQWLLSPFIVGRYSRRFENNTILGFDIGHSLTSTTYTNSGSNHTITCYRGCYLGSYRDLTINSSFYVKATYGFESIYGSIGYANYSIQIGQYNSGLYGSESGIQSNKGNYRGVMYGIGFKDLLGYIFEDRLPNIRFYGEIAYGKLNDNAEVGTISAGANYRF